MFGLHNTNHLGSQGVDVRREATMSSLFNCPVDNAIEGFLWNLLYMCQHSVIYMVVNNFPSAYERFIVFFLLCPSWAHFVIWYFEIYSVGTKKKSTRKSAITPYLRCLSFLPTVQLTILKRVIQIKTTPNRYYQCFFLPLLGPILIISIRVWFHFEPPVIKWKPLWGIRHHISICTRSAHSLLNNDFLLVSFAQEYLYTPGILFCGTRCY